MNSPFVKHAATAARISAMALQLAQAATAARISAMALQLAQEECGKAGSPDRDLLSCMVGTIIIDAFAHSFLTNMHLLPEELQASPEYRKALEHIVGASWQGNGS
jgi:hypothetical protein